MSEDGKKIATDLMKLYSNANLFQYDEGNEEIISLNDLSDYKPHGPHSNKFEAISEFYKEHLGEMTIFVQN